MLGVPNQHLLNGSPIFEKLNFLNKGYTETHFMKYIIVLFLILITKMCTAQDLVDSVAKNVCKCIQENNNLNDSGIIKFCFSNAMNQIKEQPTNEDKFQKLYDAVYYRLQSTCNIFMALWEKMNPHKSDWEQIDGNLPTKLDSLECKKFLGYKTLYYLEAEGDTTHFTINNGYWTDFFKGGKYHSECAVTWTSPSDIQLEFIKSDYPPRMGLAKKGQKFIYRLIDKTDTYYLVAAHYGTIWNKFKIYFR